MGTENNATGRDMKITVGDIDIDVADRIAVLDRIQHVAASIKKIDQSWTKHNTGIYVTDIPSHPVTGISTIDYQEAEQRGYIKIDILNNSVYSLIENRQQLIELSKKEPDWRRLKNKEFFEKIVHIGNHYNLYQNLNETITRLEHMAMFLALIRPAKRHLVGRPWDEISKTVWEKSLDGSYGFKKSHAFSYALLVSVHMNLLD